LPEGYNELDAFTEHLIEALDATLTASGAIGTWRTEHVLRAALARHGFDVVPSATRAKTVG